MAWWRRAGACSKTTTWILSGIRDPNAMPRAELERVTSVLLPLSPIAAKPARVKSTRDRFVKSKAMRKNLKVRACVRRRFESCHS